jgi:hypothetical protein
VWGDLDEVAVPRYFFAIRWPDGRKQDDPDGTFLPNEAAALSYAERTIESLRKENWYDDPEGAQTGLVLAREAGR